MPSYIFGFFASCWIGTHMHPRHIMCYRLHSVTPTPKFLDQPLIYLLILMIQSTLRPGVIRSFWNATESTSPAMNLITSLHHRPHTPYTCHMFLSCLCEIFNVASTVFPDGNDLLTNKLQDILQKSQFTSTEHGFAHSTNQPRATLHYRSSLQKHINCDFEA